MNTPTNAYPKKFSSGLIVALFLVSGLVVFLPAALPVRAANSQFSASFTYPYATVNTAVTRAISISNPAGNAGIVEIDVSVPLAAAQAVSAGSCTAANGFINTCLGSVSGAGPWTVVYAATVPAGATMLAQGSAAYLNIGFKGESAESTLGVVDVFSMTVLVHYTDGSTQSTKISFYEGSATKVTAAQSGTTFTVGSGVSLTATVAPADQGVPLTFSLVTPTVPATFSATFSPASGSTPASGVLASSLVSTYAAINYVVAADAGTLGHGDNLGNLVVVDTPAFVYVAGAPTKVAVSTFWDVAGDTPSYVGLVGGVVTAESLGVTLADKYGNPQTPGVASTFTATALAGTIKYAAGTDGTIAAGGAITSGATYSPTNPTTGLVLSYGTFDLVTVTITVPSGTVMGTYTGSSTQLSIGYLGTWVNAAPTVNVYTASKDPTCLALCPVAGTKVQLSLNTGQVGDRVNFTLTHITTTYTGTFANGKSWIVVSSNSNDIAAANFTSDTTEGDIATGAAIVNEPTTAAPTTTATSLSSGEIYTGYATAAALGIVTSFDSVYPPAHPSTYVSPTGTLYVVVYLADAYGNIVSNPSAAAYQVTLAVTAGSLTGTTTYISPTKSDTYHSGFIIEYVASSATGTVSLTASTTAAGITAASTTIKVVSIDPSVLLTPPVATILSKNTVLINATGIPSKAATPGTGVVEFLYSLNGAANATAGITSTNSTGAAFTSFIVSLANGTNTIKLYATDSAANTGYGTFTFTVSHGPAVVGKTFVVPSGESPKEVTVSGFTGVNATFMNNGTSTFSGQVWYELLNGANQVVQGPTFVQASFTAGSSQTFFFALSPGLASGSYTAKLFVVVAGEAYSASYTAPVTAS